MKKILLTGLFLTAINVFAQQVETKDHLTCKHNYLLNKICAEQGIDFENHPDRVAYELYTQKFAQEYKEKHTRAVPYIIPVVFHIVHAGGAENISDAQVYDALAILNRDYRKLNADTSNVVNPFKSLVADCEIEFRLAQKDALGNCVSGITRTFSAETFIGETDMVDAVNKNLNNSTTNSNNIRFPRNKYLNIWICANPAGAAGYTNTPSNFTPSKYDGIWISYAYFGSIGTSSVTTSRALTHEVGHWLNLSHVWGNSNNPGVSCGDDNVGDTPETKGYTSCNLTTNDVCNPGTDENVQNYMEYAYCSRMFTIGQKTRMHAALNSSTASRNNLHTAANLIATGTDGNDILCAAAFTSDKTVICQGDSVTFSDNSYHGVTGWNWNFTGGTPSTATTDEATVTYNAPGTYAVSLTADNGSSSVSTTTNAYVTVLPSAGVALPFSEGFEGLTSIPSADWFVENPDGGSTSAWQVSTQAAYTGSKSVKLNNSANVADGNKDSFTSTTIDLSGMTSVDFNFKVAYRQKTSTNNDMLRVYVSNNCGKTWSVKKQLNGATLAGTNAPGTSAFAPTTQTQWMHVDVTNITSTFFTSDFRFKFEFTSDLGNNIFIDDINIYATGTQSTEEQNTNPFGMVVYPNPVTSNANISFSLKETANTEIFVSDILGKRILNLKNENMSNGKHNVELNAGSLATGVYFVTIRSGNITYTQKLAVQ